MLCNLPLIAGNAFRAVSQITPVQTQIVQQLRRSISFLSTSNPPVKSTASMATPLSIAPVQEGYPNFTLESSSLPLTEAQMSRAACQAVHKCLQLHSMGDAYFVVNSLRFSNFKYQNSLFKFAGVRSVADFDDVAIQFGRPVSSRLSSHALLHGLLRAGLTKKAYKLCRLMINDGTKVRSKSLEAIFHSLHSSSQPMFTPSRPIQAVPGHQIFKLQTKLANDETTRLALSLLLSAQRSWHRRTKSMYKALLALCILNGELILGSLLFGYMMRDCQSQTALHATTGLEAEAPDMNPGAQAGQKKRPYSSATLLQSLLDAINTNVELAAGVEEHHESLQAALQALAILANLLDDDQLATAGLSSLICTLYHAPKLDYYVWINEQGRPKKTRAYDYFHGVLRRLINKLSIPEQARSTLPILDISACNALLNYALRHCLSPTLGSKVLDYMLSDWRLALRPDIKTFNILIRSGTVMRYSCVVEQALSVLQRNPKNNILLSTRAATPARLPNPAAQVLNVSWTNYVRRGEIPEMDAATLCAYIIYLSTTGQPYQIVQILALLMPGLQHGQNPPLHTHKALRESDLKMAVGLGPHVLTAILTALCKAGKIGLAERVWLLALSAEWASNNPEYSHRPWSLPIHAYTIMLQCYGTQVYKRGHVVGWGRPLPFGDKTRLQRKVAALHIAQTLYEHAKAKFHKTPHPNTLDARFFNAAMKTFARHPDIRWSASRQAYPQRQCSRFTSRFTAPNLMARQIVHDILEAGYDVPAAYQHVLTENVPTIVFRRRATRLRTSFQRPFAYPPIPSQSNGLSIPTIKQRGLPMRRRFRHYSRSR